MIKVSIIGFGNVAQHLAAAFELSDAVALVQVFSRNKLVLNNSVTDISQLLDADVYIISVTDSAIAELSGKLPFGDKLVVHTSGSMPLTAVDSKNRRGVFYPLQTFSKERKVDFRNVPFCIESEFDSDFNILEELAKVLSDKVVRIDSLQRRTLHVAAVFANNFTNHLYAVAEEICIQNQIPFDILHPLISETAAKAIEISPSKAQTGPAIRNDQQTIDAHLDFLSDENQKNIYTTLTNSIRQHGKKL